MSNTALSLDDSEEATRILHEVLAKRPQAFARAFRDAENVIGTSIDGSRATIAQLWLNDYGGGVTGAQAKTVASATLGSSVILKRLGEKTRFALTNMFFPHFDLPRGWRVTAEAGRITRPQIAALVMERLRMIDAGELDVTTQHGFIRMLLTRPRNISESYREIMSQEQLNEVVRIVKQRAPGIYRQTQAETMGWRLGRL